MANPTRLSWTHSLEWEDGSPLKQAELAGFALYIDGQAAVSVPVGWEADGQWEVPLKDFPAATTFGDHRLEVSIRARRADGTVIESERSEPVSYTWADERTPSRPFGLSVA
jgi:predicted RNase H-like HicB family nuclease